MSIDYSGSIFYGLALGIDTNEFYDREEGFDQSGPIGVGIFGNYMCGTPEVAVYWKSSYVELGQDGEFGLWSLNDLDVPEGAGEALWAALGDIPSKGKPGWFVANDVS
jgi:hypothetical protein